MAYTESKTFDGINFAEEALAKGEFENCTFRNCHLAEFDLSGFVFIDCVFEGCDLSMVKLKNTSFRDVTFRNCKQLGLRFDDANKMLISFSCENCTLNLSSFYKMKLKGLQLKDCKLHEVDFIEADLTNASFHNCDLDRALFENTVLEGADFRTAYNFAIDPEINKMKKARFSSQSLGGLLTKYNLMIE
jgi:fluoroquinolone resistance protein